MSPNALDSLLQGMAQGWFWALEVILIYLRVFVFLLLGCWLLGFGGLLWKEWRQQGIERRRTAPAPLPLTEARNILLWHAR